MTVAEAAEAFGVSKITIYRLCNAGLLTHYRVGFKRGAIRIPQEAIEAYIRTNSTGGQNDAQSGQG